MRRSIGWGIRATLIGMMALGACLVCIGLIANNRPHREPTPAELQRALDRALDWVSTHRTELLSDANPALWWMLAATNERLGGDPRLESILDQYHRGWSVAPRSAALWKRMFDREDSRTRFTADDVASLTPYVRLFAYGLTCDSEIATDSEVGLQFKSSYCPDVWLMTPHCSTHQLMGMLWALDAGCDGVTSSQAAEVRARIRRELTFDFRVDDSYVQRVLLLAASDADAHELKPVWIARVLDRQLADGGWDSFDAVFYVTPSRAVCFGTRGLSIRTPAGAFHTTAQSILLLAHLLKPDASAAQTTSLAHWARRLK